MEPDPNSSLETFRQWTVVSLRHFLAKRGIGNDGNKAELAALAYSAWKLAVPLKLQDAEAIETSRKEYEEMVKIAGIPDPFTISDGWFDEKTGISLWPPIYITDVTKFLMNKEFTSAETLNRLMNEYKVGKAYEYFQAQWLREVFYKDLGGCCVLRANCSPTQRLSDPSHKVWICAGNETGEIRCAYCTCTAGLGQTCNHIAGLLFRIESANRFGLVNKSCTSIPCKWVIPNKDIVEIEPKELCQLDIKKSRYGKSEKSRLLVSSEKKDFQPITFQPDNKQPVEDIRNKLITALSSCVPEACLYKGLPLAVGTNVASSHSKNSSSTDTLLEKVSLFSVAGNFNKKFNISCLSEHDAIEKFNAFLPTLTPQEIFDVSKLTVGQSNNPSWFKVREGRVTASNLYDVFTRVNTIKQSACNVDVSKLLSRIMGYSKVNPNVKALKHGRETEPFAKQAYLNMMSEKNHSSLTTSESGIYIDLHDHFIAASPDLLVHCDCCGYGLMEAKCPMISNCNMCDKSLGGCNCVTQLLPSYLISEDNEIHLKKNHEYFAQVQGQMAVTGRSWCDFFVFTENGFWCERINFDQKYWEAIKLNVQFFIQQHIIPELMNGKLKNEQAVCSQLDTGCANTAVGTSKIGPTYFCPLCRSVVKEQENIKSFGQRSIECDKCFLWYHFKCVQITKSALTSISKNGTWFCPQCKT